MLKSFQASSRRGNYGSFRVQSGLRTGLLTLAMASAAFLHSPMAAALGLGDITLRSALGQPFNADIELIEAGGMSPEEIVVTLASPEAFAKAGIERVFFLNDLRFTPVIRGNRAIVHVESRKAVTEPYIDFLVRLSRPNGDQFHEYTVLLDPPNSATGLAATRSRVDSPATAAKTDQSRLPVAPPKAVQGKHYTVVSGDTLAGIARQIQPPSGKPSSADLIVALQALNPQAFPNGARSQLKVGQGLLLPDNAVEPKASGTSTPASAGASPVPPSSATPAKPSAGEQLTATAVENQQLTKTVDDLKGEVARVEEDDAAKNKQIIELQTQLAEMKALSSRPAPVPAPSPAVTPAAPAAAPVTAPVQKTEPVAAPVTPQPAPVVEDDELPWPTILAGLLVLALLLALAWSVRRNRISNQLALNPEPVEPIIKPAQATVTPVFEVPAVTPRPAATTTNAGTGGNQRLAGAATDALDGASIYIAYGRFAEALAILREALDRQPQRTDVRLRILELLGEQGDTAAFDEEEKILLNQGIEPEKLRDIRARYPKLNAVSAPAPSPAPASVEPAPAEPAAPVAPAVVAGAAVVAAATAAAVIHEKAPAQLDENAAASLNPEPVDDFQLNLDDLSMDANWDLVDPFDSAPAPRKPAPDAEPELDPTFASDLTQLPEVFEMPDEQFLSDFAEDDEMPGIELQLEPEAEPEVIAESSSDLLDDAFLDSFMTDDTEFDLMDLEEEAPLSKINQAQVLIDEGDVDAARILLQEVIDESDDGPQQTARDLLSGLD